MHPPDDSEPKSNVEPLRPLTKKTVTGELYTRPDKHNRDIRRALSVPVDEFEDWIRTFGYGEHRYAELPDAAPSPEALVYLYRHYLSEVQRFKRERQARARVQAERILSVLFEGIHAVVKSHLPRSKFRGVPRNRRATCVDEVVTDVLIRLNEPGNAADPLEVAFGLYMKRLSVKAVAKYRERAMTEISPSKTLVNHKEDTLDLGRQLDRERLQQAIAGLPKELRVVAKHRMLQDPPIKQSALAEELGVTERTIRNRERAVETALRQHFREDN